MTKTIEVILTYEREDDSYTAYDHDILVDGEVVGSASVMADDKSAYVECIAIHEAHQNKGYGTTFLKELSAIYGGIYLAPDNADAQRLYERIGSEMPAHRYNNSSAPYIDQGFGVYEI